MNCVMVANIMKDFLVRRLNLSTLRTEFLAGYDTDAWVKNSTEAKKFSHDIADTLTNMLSTLESSNGKHCAMIYEPILVQDLISEITKELYEL